MDIRRFKQGDEKELYEVFHNTIRKVNIQDYNENQVAAWAPDDIDMNFVTQKFRDIKPFVAVNDEGIIGYADIQPDGYIDHFYCHHQFQGKGVGRRLFSALEREAAEKRIPSMYSNVSITAKLFFEAMGFSVKKEQLVKVGDQQLKNYRMVRST